MRRARQLAMVVAVVVLVALAGCSMTACGQCHGKAAAAGPFRAWHANTRRRSPPAMDRRRASRAKPRPAPRPRPCATCCGLLPVAASCCELLRAIARCGGRSPPSPFGCPWAALSSASMQSAAGGSRGRGRGAGQGLVREARRPSHACQGGPPCVRAPSSEQSRGLGLAAPVAARPQSKDGQPPTTNEPNVPPPPLNPAAAPASAPRPSPRRCCRPHRRPARRRPARACGGAAARCGLRSSPASPAGTR
jgi:hypothetical protein